MAHWLKNLGVLIALGITPTAMAATIPMSGRLVDATGQPVTGPVEIKVDFFATKADVTALVESPVSVPSVALADGVFTINLTVDDALLTALSGPGASWPSFQITDVTHARTYARRAIGSFPQALRVPVDPTALAFDANGKLSVNEAMTSLAAMINSTSLKFDADEPAPLAGDFTGSPAEAQVRAIDGKPLSVANPSFNDVWVWSGSQWAAGAIVGADGGTVTQVDTGAGLSGSVTTTGTLDLRLNASGGLVKNLGGTANELGITTGGVTATHVASGVLTNSHVATGAGIVDSKLGTIATAGKVADSALSANVSMLGSQIDLDGADVTGVLPVTKGGTGTTTMTGIVKGNGSAAFSTAVLGTDLAAPNYLSAPDASPAQALFVDAAGQVGIGQTTPDAQLDVNGGTKIGSDGAAPCAAASDGGRMRYNSTSGYMEYCQGLTLTWVAIGQATTVPSGKVMPFNLAACPTGWSASDGAGATVDLRGMFVRGLNDFGTGARSDGYEDPAGARALGSSQDEALQRHKHDDSHNHSMPTWGSANTANVIHTPINSSLNPTTSNSTTSYAVLGDPTDSGTGAGTPRHGVETTMRNVGLIWCQKD